MPARRTYLRHLLLWRSEWIEERVMEGARRNGYAFVTPAMNRLFAHMGREPAGLSELARRMAVSRQAVHELAGEAARHGVVEFVASPTDGRVKLLRFTAAGWAMSDDAARTLEAIEAELQQRIGGADMAALQRILALPWVDGEDLSG